MRVTKPQVKFDSDTFCNFWNYLKAAMRMENAISTILKTLDDKSYSDKEQNIIIKFALDNIPDEYLKMFSINFKDFILAVTEISNQQKIFYINKARELITKKGITYLDLEDGGPYKFTSEDLDAIKEVLKDNTTVTNLRVFSVYPEVTNKAIEIVKLHPEITDFCLTVENLNVDEKTQSIIDQMQNCHYLENFTLYHSFNDFLANPVCSGVHIPVDLLDS